MSAPVLESSSTEVQVLVHPVDAEAEFRHSCALTEVYAGFLKPDGGEGAVGAEGGKNKEKKPPKLLEEDEKDGGGYGTADAQAFKSLEWQGQPFLSAADGPLEWVRLAEGGQFEKGVKCAQECQPQRELCGWSIRPKLIRMHSNVEGEGTDETSDLRPRFPDKQPVLEWKSIKGKHWERLIPARMPLWGGIRHREAAPDSVFQVNTAQNLPKNTGICVVFDLGGQIYEHDYVPAIRLEWGEYFAFILRGMDGSARPCIEERRMEYFEDRPINESYKMLWYMWRRFDDAPPLDEEFWRKRHVLRLYRMAGKLIIELDGKGWWVVRLADIHWKEHKTEPRPIPVEWPAAPLKISIYGVDCLLQVGTLDFDRAAWFSRDTPVAQGPSLPSSFYLSGAGTQYIAFSDSSLKPPFESRGQLQGANLHNIFIAGEWTRNGAVGNVSYLAALSGDKTEVPLLSASSVILPPTGRTPFPTPLDLRPALIGLNISSGEPGATPSTEARLDVEPALLDRFHPNWREILQPFRSIEINARESPDEPWRTLFRGYLLPDAQGQEGYNLHRLSFVARDPMMRLQAPAALVDSRFAPLDLFSAGNVLYGTQCVQHLLSIEMGLDEVLAFNGNGNPFRYLPAGHYPLFGSEGDDVFTIQNIPKSGNFRLPPPFGEDLKRWIDTIAEYDHAVWFYDPSERGFIYGHLRQLFAERSAKVWPLRGATTEYPAGNNSPNAWPLLSQYGRSGWIDHAYTGVQVWGTNKENNNGLMPALIVGKYQPLSGNDLDPFGEKQSWRRTLLVKQDFLMDSDHDFANEQAWRMWQEFGGKAPYRFDFTISDGSALWARWGELANWRGDLLRIVRVEHTFSFGQDSERLVTNITARSLSGTGM